MWMSTVVHCQKAHIQGNYNIVQFNNRNVRVTKQDF